MLLYYSQTVSAIATATCDLRAVALLRCAVAVLLFEAITLPPRGDLEEVSLTWAGVTMSNESRPRQKKFFFGLDMCWLQKHNSGPILVETVDQFWSKQWTNSGRDHTPRCSHGTHVVSASFTRRVRLCHGCGLRRKLLKTTSPGTLHGRCTRSKAVGTSNHNIP